MRLINSKAALGAQPAISFIFVTQKRFMDKWIHQTIEP